LLRFREHGSAPETLPNRIEQREGDREHGIRKLWLPSFNFNWLNENRGFGRDSSGPLDAAWLFTTDIGHAMILELPGSEMPKPRAHCSNDTSLSNVNL